MILNGHQMIVNNLCREMLLNV
uniref:Uncharacterized protein n=1 Tax=Tetranychus urticae TaxID=32264 RepID=T1KFX1_TETUR